MPGGAEDAATRVRDELNAAWPRGRTPASGSTPLVALAKNMSSVLQHLEAASVVTTDADDETTQVASLRAFSEREIVVDVHERSGAATRAMREKLGAVGGTRVREAGDASGDGDVALVVIDGQEEIRSDGQNFEADRRGVDAGDRARVWGGGGDVGGGASASGARDASAD